MFARRLCIAIVDNDDGLRRAIVRLLDTAGMDAVAFASGRAFLEAALPGLFDCVVLDLHMPEMTGFDVLSEVTRRGIGVPVVIVTGHDTPENRAQAIAAGVPGYLPKPVEARLLLAAIDEAVHRGRHQEAIGALGDRVQPSGS